MRVTLTLASLAMAALAACSTHATTSHDSLVGHSVASLRGRLGPPVEVEASAGVLRLSYRNRKGELVENAVIVLGRTVAKAANDLVPNAPKDTSEELTLAPITEAIDRLGPVQDVTVGRLSSRVDFDGWRAIVIDDLVIGLRKT